MTSTMRLTREQQQAAIRERVLAAATRTSGRASRARRACERASRARRRRSEKEEC